MVGVASNAFAVVINGGWMPVWEPALALVGFTTNDLVPTFHVLLPTTLDAQFLRMAGPFGDLVPIPLPILPNVASIGDVFISLGLGWFVFATMIRGATAEQETVYVAPTVVEAARLRRPIKAALSATAISPETGLPATPSYEDVLSLDRPTLLGGSSAGAMPVTTLRRDDVDYATLPPAALAAATAVPPIVARISEHPYVRLALDARFVAFWLGQTISLFGDRLHQVALAVLVFGVTDSALATAARLPDGRAAEPAHRADRRHLRRPLGPARDDGRERPAPSGARARSSRSRRSARSRSSSPSSSWSRRSASSSGRPRRQPCPGSSGVTTCWPPTH